VPSVRDYTDPFLQHYCPVPPVGPGVCDVCHGAPGVGWERCYSCNQTTGQVSHPIELVVPISLATKEGQFYHVLKSYKGWYATENQRLQLASLFARFLAQHGKCIRREADMDWNVITIVPSTGDRMGAHPLENVLSRVPALRSQYEALLVRGTAPIGHNLAADDGYQVTSDVSDRRVLLIDDTFTTGGRVQSAASALQLAGARIASAVVAARIINPEFDTSRELWERQRGQPFSFEVCCLCALAES